MMTRSRCRWRVMSVTESSVFELIGDQLVDSMVMVDCLRLCDALVDAASQYHCHWVWMHQLHPSSACVRGESHCLAGAQPLPSHAHAWSSTGGPHSRQRRLVATQLSVHVWPASICWTVFVKSRLICCALVRCPGCAVCIGGYCSRRVTCYILSRHISFVM